jgi:hypothetical protein
MATLRVSTASDEVHGRRAPASRKLKHRGGERVNWQFLFTAAAYNGSSSSRSALACLSVVQSARGGNRSAHEQAGRDVHPVEWP